MELSGPVVVQHHSDFTFTLDFQGQIYKLMYLDNGRPIDMERKGCESIECWTHGVTLNFDLTHDLDLGFSRWNIKIALSRGV